MVTPKSCLTLRVPLPRHALPPRSSLTLLSAQTAHDNRAYAPLLSPAHPTYTGVMFADVRLGLGKLNLIATTLQFRKLRRSQGNENFFALRDSKRDHTQRNSSRVVRIYKALRVPFRSFDPEAGWSGTTGYSRAPCGTLINGRRRSPALMETPSATDFIPRLLWVLLSGHQ
jgi:hypothetical protein